MGIEKFLFNPIVLGAFGVAMAVGLLIIGITIVLFKFLRKRIAQDILGMPAPGGPDSETWPYRTLVSGQCTALCQEHKGVVERLVGVDGELNEIENRQKTLREDLLPDKYVTRREHDTCKHDRQSHETELFNRVGILERGGGK